ncbi:hypothetical protein LR948_11115 [Roseivivax sp. GX 12232]|uniref:hypothetical protein n=1 Tax=Roseivivax sp. GX 12232 TaxID=2900547 RepID=UPI001E2CEB8B|nr:hypothetical protein [Roseivivax sp. GX 12232]MCE0505909.1 hypothetical protein [Roseivivax sp. GX 12232]
MNQINTSLEDLLVAACGDARALSEGLQATYVGSRASDAHAVRRCISGLETGDLLRSDLDGSLAELRRRLQSALVEETIDTETYFDGYFDPDFGDVGTVREIPILTDHGHALAALFERLEALIELRQEARDLLRAERLLVSLM